MSIPLYQVDAFTRSPFAGNPAGVAYLAEERSPAWMQALAMEMNLSETAFLTPVGDGFKLRWFTPKAEVKLCGHATLASAHILWEQNYLSAGEMACFHTLSGPLTARRNGDWIEMDFPAKPVEAVIHSADLEAALGVKAIFIGKNEFDYLVEVENEATIRNLQPDITRLGELPIRGVIVTARCTSGEFDFVSRFFAPAVGVNEDPVTGSAHCCLGPYWQGISGKTDFLAYQASPRGGIVRVCMRGDRVLLSGQAVTVFKTELRDLADN